MYFILKVGKNNRLQEIAPYKAFQTEEAAITVAKEIIEKMKKRKSLYGFDIIVGKSIKSLSLR
jgi:hypothetical protein